MLPTEWLHLKAPAKINLFLQVTGRRADGYHTIASRMQKVSLFDELTFRLKPEGLRVICHDDSLREEKDNLVYKAARLFLEAHRKRCGCDCPGVEIVLKKNIPIAAGLGGGSSDAAITLHGLNLLLQAKFSQEELALHGLKLGADVPFFVRDYPAAMALGIGEDLSPAVSLQGYRVVLVNPGFPISTQWVYERFDLTSKTATDNIQSSKVEYAGELIPVFNDLEEVTCQCFPIIRKIRDELLASGAKVALMSGSGATVFGLFRNFKQAEKAVHEFRSRFLGSYVVDPLHYS
jgi:4-diphosphocytidyl-2-C-methyl-D-erythritol kinase